MKVMHLGKYYSPVHGGIETHLRVLASGLTHRGLEVDVVVSNLAAVGSEETHSGIKIVRLPRYLELFGAPVYLGIAKCIRTMRPDIVHLHWPNPWCVIGYLYSGHRGPLVITYHSDVMGRKISMKVFASLLRAVLDKADIILATSPNYISSSPVLSQYAQKCRVVPLGIHWSQFETVDENEVREIRARFRQPIVLAVGRLVGYKGFEYLIRSMRNIEGQLIIIGEGGLQKELQNEILRCGLKDRAVILSHVNDVRSYYHASDVFVLPSVTRAEALGIA